jgi:hypothetical protein
METYQSSKEIGTYTTTEKGMIPFEIKPFFKAILMSFLIRQSHLLQE